MSEKSRNHARLRRHRRVRKKIHGTPARPRLNVYRSLNQIYAQVIDDESGRTLAAASTVEATLSQKLTGLNKTAQARVVGEALAERAGSQGIKSVVFDRGGFQYMGRVKALAEGARAGGLEF